MAPPAAPDYIYASIDGGATWTQQTDAGARLWGGIASSADGSKLLAGDISSPAGYVYTATLSPTLTTSAASSISTTGATLNGSITDVGNGTSTTEGFVYGTDTTYGATTTQSGSFGTGSFTTDISSLVCNITYHTILLPTPPTAISATAPTRHSRPAHAPHLLPQAAEAA